MEPSVIHYWKNSRWVKVKRIFYSEDEITEWYRRNRSRIDGLTVVKPLIAKEQKTLTE